MFYTTLNRRSAWQRPICWLPAPARNLGISRQTLHAVLAERSGVPAEMALRRGVLPGNGAQLWVDMQTKCDLWQTEAKLHDVLVGMRRIDRLPTA